MALAQWLSFLGVTLNLAANPRATGNDTVCISAVQVWVIPTPTKAASPRKG
jgi:hypothetical protein